jgi:hypothetical protein
LCEIAPSRKQKRFVFLFRRRKGKETLKQKVREKVLLVGKSSESNYSIHSIEEMSFDNIERIYKKNQEQIQGSSLKSNLIAEKVMENSISYKNFKKFIREAIRISSTIKKKASNDRHKKEAIAFLKAEKERTHIILILKKILNSWKITENSKSSTRNLLRKSYRKYIFRDQNFKYISLIIKEIFNQIIRKDGTEVINEERKNINENTSPNKESSSVGTESSLKNHESIYWHKIKATAFHDSEETEVQISRLSEKVNQSMNFNEIQFFSLLIYIYSLIMSRRSGIELVAIIGFVIDQLKQSQSKIEENMKHLARKHLDLNMATQELFEAGRKPYEG